MTARNVWTDELGYVHARGAQAARLIDVLGLDEPDAVEYRQLWIDIVALAAARDRDPHDRLMGYPDDLPDLARLRPPGGNARPGGVESSHSRRRPRGGLTPAH